MTWVWLLEFVLRTTLLALGAGLCLWVFQVRSAQLRRGVWLAVLLGMMVSPFFLNRKPRLVWRLLPETVRFELSAPTPAAEPAEIIAPVPTSTGNGDSLPRAAAPPTDMAVDAAADPGVSSAGWHMLTAEAVPFYERGWFGWSLLGLYAGIAGLQLWKLVRRARRREPSIRVVIAWLGELNRAVFWLHPLAWWLKRQLD